MTPSTAVIASQCRVLASEEVLARGQVWSSDNTVPITLIRTIGDFLSTLFWSTKSHVFKYVIKTKQKDGSWKVTTNMYYDCHNEFADWRDAFVRILKRVDESTEVTLGQEGILINGGTYSIVISVQAPETTDETTGEAPVVTLDNDLPVEAEPGQTKKKRKRIQK